MNNSSFKYLKAVFYGCFSPLDVFLEIFQKKDIEITEEEVRKHMGYQNWDRNQAISKLERFAMLWKEKYGQYPKTKDVDELYADFEPALLSISSKPSV
ncbi:hypothetical protein HUG15_02925 [Salicibibacter cibarius]|uniref:Uncharacterized protein n=1 Tax=Salicibibacter cibarius TaxID=2743000 RepID=A0A7T6Z0D6_9BACI|nr:phosphonoacetaldehyde hydrolase [Salicibibacter cibarius]QQK74655.1 hypothetical protein HUG15_02925 [Salicibibacter cibarius]